MDANTTEVVAIVSTTLVVVSQVVAALGKPKWVDKIAIVRGVLNFLTANYGKAKTVETKK